MIMINDCFRRESRSVARRATCHINAFRLARCGEKFSLEKQNVKICRVQTCSDLNREVLLNHEIVSRDERISELEQALRDITLQDAKIENFWINKEARKFLRLIWLLKNLVLRFHFL